MKSFVFTEPEESNESSMETKCVKGENVVTLLRNTAVLSCSQALF